MWNLGNKVFLENGHGRLTQVYLRSEPVSGSGITGGGPGTPPFWRGSVTLKRVGLFCFPIKHSTHTQVDLSNYLFDLN